MARRRRQDRGEGGVGDIPKRSKTFSLLALISSSDMRVVAGLPDGCTCAGVGDIPKRSKTFSLLDLIWSSDREGGVVVVGGVCLGAGRNEPK